MTYAFLQNFGYYYPHNDIEIASEQLNEVIKNHNKNISEYKVETKKLIESYGINNDQNKKEYLKLINNELNK